MTRFVIRVCFHVDLVYCLIVIMWCICRVDKVPKWLYEMYVWHVQATEPWLGVSKSINIIRSHATFIKSCILESLYVVHCDLEGRYVYSVSGSPSSNSNIGGQKDSWSISGCWLGSCSPSGWWSVASILLMVQNGVWSLSLVINHIIVDSGNSLVSIQICACWIHKRLGLKTNNMREDPKKSRKSKWTCPSASFCLLGVLRWLLSIAWDQFEEVSPFGISKFFDLEYCTKSWNCQSACFCVYMLCGVHQVCLEAIAWNCQT